MTRPDWINLNGWWEFAILPKNDPPPHAFDRRILVPYAVESLLSGVREPLLPHQRLWYRRSFQRPTIAGENTVLLHFGAVDYECNVWVNGKHIGAHRGGYLPFTFDIGDALIDDANLLLVSVWDPTDAGLQQRGKQVLQARDIWYTAVSGIWQTVWLEVVPEISIESLRLTPDLQTESLTVEVKVRGQADNVQVEAQAFSAGEKIAWGRTQAQGATSDRPKWQVKLQIPNPVLWSPANPHLYDLQLRLIREGQVLDEVGSYFAMRKFGLVKTADGHLRFALNAQPLFLYGPLDQGYFPDGLYTPPSEDAMLFDLEFARHIGCNMIRKHIKIEPLRWYYHCDRLGIVVWQDMPNGGLVDSNVVALALKLGIQLKDTRWLRRFGRGHRSIRAEYRADLQGMIDHLYNTACIAVWVPFNESWGQFQANAVSAWVKAYDPTRLVDHASGWFDQGGGDFQSKHIYAKKLKRPEPDGRAFVISEFGGYSLMVPDHTWAANQKFGYRFYDSSEALTDAYLDLLENGLKPLIAQGLMAAVYTQTTDVETECNGYLTYDRQVEKMDAQALRRAHLALQTNTLDT